MAGVLAEEVLTLRCSCVGHQSKSSWQLTRQHRIGAKEERGSFAGVLPAAQHKLPLAEAADSISSFAVRNYSRL